MKSALKIAALLLVSVTGISLHAQVISAFPHTENFESFTPCTPTCAVACPLAGGWVNVTNDGMDWTVHKGSTSTLNTGPDFDHNPGNTTGNYLYTETSGSCTNTTAAFLTPPVNLTGVSNFTLDFWYHMFGNNMGILHVDVSSNNGSSYVDDVMAPFSTNSNFWGKKSVNLDSYVGDTIIIRLRAVTGNGGAGDMAVDDFTFYTQYNADAGVARIDSPSAPLSTGLQNVFVTIENYGADTLTSADVQWSVNNSAQTTYNWAGSLAPNQTALVTIGVYNFMPGNSDVKVWTANPNNSSDQNNSNDTASVLLCTALSGIYTIGGALPDFIDLNEATNALNSCGVSGAVVFNVAAGSGPHFLQLNLFRIIGSSAVNTITINGNGETLTTAPNTDARHVVKLDGAKHVTLDNLNIVSTDATYGWGVYLLNQADSNTLKNCTVNVSAVTNTGTSNSAGIVATASNTSVATAGNNAKHLTLQNNTIIGGYQGIRLLGAQLTPASNHVLSGNTIRDFYSTGIHLADCDKAIITGNDLSRANLASVGVFQGIYFGARNQRALVEKNRIHNTHGSAITLTGSSYGIFSSGCDAAVGFENRFVNNAIYNFNGNGTVYGIYNSSSNGASYYHNTIAIDNVAATAGIVRGFYQTTTATDIQFRNNIITLRQGGSGAKHCIYFGSTTSSIVCNNNAFYTDTLVNNIGFYSVDYNSLADWQTANSGAYDGNSVFGDPIYVNTSNNFTPTNGAINDVGANLGVAADIAGNSRSATTPDPGAYEFTPPTLDVALSWVAPVSPTSAGNKTIIVKITNSVSSLSAITDVSLTYTDGIAPVTESFSSLNILPGASADLSFTTLYNLTAQATVRAYINSVNGASDAISANDTTEQVLCPSLSGAYTIDKTQVTGGTNFASFTAAVAALSSCGIFGPVTFNVASGSGPYFEQITIPAISGASSVNTITFNGNNNTLNFSPTSVNRHLIRLAGAQYVTFNNLNITSVSLSYGWGAHLQNGANYNTFNNCAFNLSSVTSVQTGDFAGIVASASQTDITASGNNANYTTISNCTIIGGGYGIRLNGNSTTKARGNNILNNTIRDFYSYGVYLIYSDSAQIVGNDISRANKTDVGSFYGIYLTTGVENTMIERNSIHNTHDNALSPTGLSYPIYFNGADAQLGKENYVVNNLIYNINSNGEIYGIYNSNSDHAKYYHNTISLDDTTAITTDDTRGFYQTTSAAGIDFRNNIVTVRRSGTGSKYCIYLGTTASTVISDRNVLLMDAFQGVDNHVGRFGSTDFTTFAQWQTANTGAYDQNSVSADPFYTDATNADFTPQNYIINNKGTGVGVTIDYNLNPRNAVSPDPGAYEFTPSGLDAAITWVAPVTPLSAGAQIITVNISNTQTAPITDLTLTYTDGSAFVKESFSSLSIAGGANQDISFTTPYNVSGYAQAYAFIDSVNLAQDENQLNDTTVTQSLCAALNGNFTIDKNSASSATNFVSFTEAVDRLANCGIAGPVTLTVVQGSSPYNEQIIIPQIFGASATNTITIEGNDETLSFAPTIDDKYLIRMNGAKHLSINNLNIRGTATTYGYGIQFINAADSNSVSGCTINLSAVTGTGTDNSAGILFSGSNASASAEGNTGNYNHVTNNEIIGGYYGVRVNGIQGAPVQGNQFVNNIVRDFYTYGFYLGNTENTDITGNDINRANRVVVSTFYGVNMVSGNQNVRIISNRIHNTHDNASSLTGAAYPIYFSSTDATVGNENSVVNNAIYNINNNGTIYAFYNSSSDGAHYYHNSISLDEVNSSGGVTRGFFQTTVAANIDFRNNVVSIKRGGTGSKHCIYLASASDVNSDYNLFYIDTVINDVGYFSPSNFAGLAAWKTANGSAYDQNSLFADPAFGNSASGNLTPLNIAVNDKATPLGVTEDINQTPRSLTTPDMGAFEYTPAQIDATVVSLLEPENDVCGSTLTSVFAVITNFGADTISAIPVTANITGAFTGTLTGISGSVGNAQSDTVLLGSITLPASGSLVFTIFSSAPNDELPANDTLVATVQLSPAIAAPTLLTTTDTICKNASAILLVNVNPTLAYYWYDAPSGGNQVHAGALFATPALAASDTFYAEASSDVRYAVGAEDITIGASGNFVSVGGEGLLFTVHAAMRLDSVSVYANDTGTVYVELTDASNTNVLQITSAQVNAIGTKVTIPVGFVIAPGSYRIDANGSTTGGLLRNTAGASYPYEIPGVVSITGSTAPNPAHYYFFYDWKIIVSQCVSARTGAPVIVNQNDTAVAATFASTTAGLDVTFTPDDNNVNNSYGWNFGDGATSNIGSIAHQYTTDGTYNACLTVSNSCSQATTCQQVVVCGDLQSDFSFTPSGLTATFNFTGTGLPATYAWDFGDASTSTAASPSHTFASAGSYDVTLIVENACSESDTFSQSVTVCVGIDADFTATQTTPNGLAFDFTSTSTGNPASILWDFGDGATGTNAIEAHSFPAHGNYDVKLLVTNACGETDSLVQTVITCLAADAAFTATVQSDGKTVTIINSSTGTNLTSNWNFGDGSTATDEEPTHTYLMTGNYTITLTVTDACGQTDAQTQTVDISVGIAQVNPLLNINVFPNPNNGEFTISYELQTDSEVSIRLFNFMGAAVYESAADKSQGAHPEKIELLHIPTGIYLLVLTTQKGAAVMKVAVE